MADFSSPGVYTFEKDTTFNINSIESNASSMVGLFNWGAVNALTRITTNDSELVRKMGRPDLITTQFFHSASNFIKYSTPLYIVRAVDEDVAKNAVPVGGTSEYVPNEDAYEEATLTGNSFIGRYPGVLGNNLSIVCANSADYESWEYANQFSYTPEAGEFNMVVIDRTGAITGDAGSILERYELMTTVEGSKKDDGTPADIKLVLLEQSDWILLGDGDEIVFTDTGSVGIYSIDLEGGVDGNDLANASWQDALAALENTETLDIISLFTSLMPKNFVGNAVDLADTRQDCVCFDAPELSDVFNNKGATDDVIEYFNTTLNKNTSYAFFVDNWKQVYDRYNNINIWIPCCSDAAGLNSRVYAESEPWFPPAGLNRGQLRNVQRLAWSANKRQRDLLYRTANVNSIIDTYGEGRVLFGDKTALKRPSAFSRINVRNLFIVLKKSIAKAARYQLFELNDAITQSIFKNATDRYLENVQGRRGIRRFKVVCDDTNNTAYVLNNNQFVGDIYIDPARSINFIILNFVAVDAGVDFEEVEGA